MIRVGDVVSTRNTWSLNTRLGEDSLPAGTNLLVERIRAGQLIVRHDEFLLTFEPNEVVKVPPCPTCGAPIVGRNVPPKKARSAKECMAEFLRQEDNCRQCLERLSLP